MSGYYGYYYDSNRYWVQPTPKYKSSGPPPRKKRAVGSYPPRTNYKGPVQVLYDTDPKLVYIVKEKGPPSAPFYSASVVIDGRTFTADDVTKWKAKENVALMILQERTPTRMTTVDLTQDLAVSSPSVSSPDIEIILEKKAPNNSAPAAVAVAKDQGGDSMKLQESEPKRKLATSRKVANDFTVDVLTKSQNFYSFETSSSPTLPESNVSSALNRASTSNLPDVVEPKESAAAARRQKAEEEHSLNEPIRLLNRVVPGNIIDIIRKDPKASLNKVYTARGMS